MDKADSGADAEAFLSISNVFNKDPAPIANSNYWYGTVNGQLYDVLGRNFHAGIRLKM